LTLLEAQLTISFSFLREEGALVRPQAVNRQNRVNFGLDEAKL